jgi:two-component system nitrate/nitrite sensor histidine kinase NarX
LPLPADVQVQVLHVVQEALSNARKHARASQVVLHVTKGAEWRFEVQDDGHGFSPQQTAGQSTHVGMKIMQERAARIGATVQVHSEVGQGTRVVLTLPTHPVSGASQGSLHLDAGVLASLEMGGSGAQR